MIAIRSVGNFRHAAYDSLLGWISLPNLHDPDYFGAHRSLSTNRDGMRIRVGAAADSATRRLGVICSGDSFTFGSGVGDDDTFCADLETDFPAVQTLNMAQPGYGIDQAYLWYRRDGSRHPHQLHLFTFIWDDFERMALTSFTGYPKPRLGLHADTIEVRNIPVPRWHGISNWPGIARVLTSLRLVQLVERRVNRTDELNARSTEHTVWPVAEAVFRDLNRLNRKRGSELVLVYLPTLQDIDPGPLDARRAMLKAFSKRSGIPFIDLTPEMREVSPDSLPWMFITPHVLKVTGLGGHYDAPGNRWVADRLAEHLRRIPGVDSLLAAGHP
jgi:hypothetical protein